MNEIVWKVHHVSPLNCTDRAPLQRVNQLNETLWHGIDSTVFRNLEQHTMRSHILPTLSIALFVSLEALAAAPTGTRYTRVDALMPDMVHVTTNTKESAYLRFVAAGDDGIYHVCIVANNPTKVVRMTGHYLDSALKVANGEFTFFHTNGRKESNGVFVNGVKAGEWLRWNACGERLATKQYIGLAGDAFTEHLGLTSMARMLPSTKRREVTAMTF